jgi:hypothetical protein
VSDHCSRSRRLRAIRERPRCYRSADGLCCNIMLLPSGLEVGITGIRIDLVAAAPGVAHVTASVRPLAQMRASLASPAASQRACDLSAARHFKPACIDLTD